MRILHELFPSPQEVGGAECLYCGQHIPEDMAAGCRVITEGQQSLKEALVLWHEAPTPEGVVECAQV